ncbi:uncharacterized protein LOC129004960, partial [Macrosteles quadrilineatus]|uniref:uncharacterized protein LOC129004960 n=1 Tax=Macrosteles quadrilineatus TaxID=74068 RepID=UPI0023E1DED3
TDALLTSVALLPVILGFTTTPSPTPSPCKLSEFHCNNNKCVPATAYCNAVNDCGDSSDEPRLCSPCNRTYYGDLGTTYELELHRPREDRLPFVCHLTLTAGSGSLGDIVQVTFESFTLGRFTSFLSGGCPDGEMQLWEWQRPRIGGAWCGTSWGPSVYFSETRSVTISVTLRRISKDQDGYNFDFRLGYKMLPKYNAIVRYGGLRFLDPFTDFTNTSLPPTVTPQHYLGDLIGGTFCSRVFTDCNRKDCRLQSPNFPGVYPRNLTCYYAIRQQEVPPGKYALISVRQPKGQLVNIRSQSALYARAGQQPNQNTAHLKVWQECDEVQDYVTVYDGYTTRDPVLLKFCGGGVAVPEAVSSTHELLVEFSTSPYGTFLYPAPPMPLHGFQLQVQVRFVDKESPKYARNKRCEFWLKGAGKGVLESPRHSLAANTTCLYHLQGMEPGTPPPPRHLELSRRRTQALIPTRFKVWLAVLKYHVTPADDTECATRLQVWDGNIRASPSCNEIYCEEKEGGSMVYSAGRSSNLTLLARYCKDHIPRSCDHSLLNNATRATRPCSLAESFLSTGDSMTLELKVTHSTALRPLSFRALYEFVDLHQDGEPYGQGPCSRKFTSRSQHLQGEPQNFTSPRDVFLFGRGGTTNLSCVYRFEAQRGDSVRITIHGMQTANRSSCVTRNNTDSGRLQCVGNATAQLRIWEVSWSTTIPLGRDCLCGGADHFLPYTFTSAAHIVEVHFTALHMTSTDDYRGLNFRASWEFVRTPVCPRKQRIAGISGELLFQSPSRTPDEVNCEGHPWVITPLDARFLYVQIKGTVIRGAAPVDSNSTSVSSSSRCPTRNRMLLHSGGGGQQVLVCPLDQDSAHNSLVEVFSAGWMTDTSPRKSPGFIPDTPQTRSVLVEFLPKEPGKYTVTWMEISRRPNYPTADMALSDCPHRCPELDACINASLWCDGTSHCPSGYDEAFTHCLYLLQLPLHQMALWILGFLILVASVCCVFCHVCRAEAGSRLKSLPSDTDPIVGTPKEVIC